jgi:Bacterial protein of unknown function (DUF839)
MTGAGIGDPGNPAWAAVPDHTYGSAANCAGGVSPWGTALSAEENWADLSEIYGWGPDFLPENHGGLGWILEVDPERASEPAPGLVVVPFKGHGFPRPDFVGEAELHLDHGKVAKVVFRAP